MHHYLYINRELHNPKPTNPPKTEYSMVPKMKNWKIPSVKTVISTVASAAATMVVIRSIARDLLPYEIQTMFKNKIFNLFSSVSSQITIIIEEIEDLNENLLFQAIELYLGSILISPSVKRFKASIPSSKDNKLVLFMDKNQELVDFFNGVHLTWTKVNKKVTTRLKTFDEDGNKSTSKTDKLHYELSFHEKHREMVFNTYLPYILTEATKIKEANKKLKIHTLANTIYRSSSWLSTNLDHPATFDTLAMDLDTKKTIMEDLELFVKRKDFYKKVGKAWKRGYLLFGPPGTGKSTLIAAIANYLNFDIYDLELTSLRANSDLRSLILATANRSVLVVEDIDCSIDLERTKKTQKPEVAQVSQITLSGLLNFIDGLWSSCGDERIIIFTTNHKERLDPALLRPGRMDVHISMSYCTFCGFKMLASNYLGLTDHLLFEEVEDLICAAKVTPAEVGEQLLRSEEPETALKGLVEFLKAKKDENELKARKSKKKSSNGEIVEEAIEKGGSSREIVCVSPLNGTG